MSYLPFASLFISTQFLFLNLDGWFVVLSNRLITFDIPLLYYHYYYYYYYYYYYHHDYYYYYYYINYPLILNHQKCFVFVSGQVFETLVILSAILFTIKSLVASVVFWMTLFEEKHLFQIVWYDQEVFDYIYCLKFYLYF